MMFDDLSAHKCLMKCLGEKYIKGIILIPILKLYLIYANLNLTNKSTKWNFVVVSFPNFVITLLVFDNVVQQNQSKINYYILKYFLI